MALASYLRMREMTLPRMLGAGAAGTAALTLVHEISHRVAPESPRLDVLGMRAIVRGMRKAGAEVPHGRAVPALALVGDLLMNSGYYGLTVGRDRNRMLLRGALAGLGAGVAAVAMAPRLGLNETTGYHRGRRLGMLGLYMLGGLATAGAAALLARRPKPWYRKLGRALRDTIR